MRRFLYLLVVSGVVSVMVVTLASASGSANKATLKPLADENPAYTWMPAGEEPAGTATNDWEYPDGDNAHTDYSVLNQINTTNVGKLQLSWQDSLDGPTYAGNLEGAPIVVSGANNNLPDASGTMFISSNGGLDALNPVTGAILWAYQGPPATATPQPPTPAPNAPGGVAAAAPTQTNVSGGLSSRDESFGDGMVFVGQQDGSLVALDAKTGHVVWTYQVSAAGTFAGHVSLTAPATTFAPIGPDGIVLSGPNNGDSALRGHEDAIDAKTGALLWRFYTTPDPTQLPFILTWANPAEPADGGGAVWTNAAVDVQHDLVYIGVGNAYPYTGRAPGKDLWSDSMVALNGSTGAIKWYYQQVHHDIWDFDDSNPATLFNVTINGKMYPAIAQGNKDGYLFVLNRITGGYLPNFPIPEVPVPNLNGGLGAALNNTWPTQPEPSGGAGEITVKCPTAAQAAYAIPSYPTASNGEPMVLSCTFATPYSNEFIVSGGITHAAGINYPPKSYDPLTGDMYVCANDGIVAEANISPESTALTNTEGTLGGVVAAVNMSTNKLMWSVQWPNDAGSICDTGAVSTAGGLVFTASEGNTTVTPAVETSSDPPWGGVVYALSATTGATLWSWQAPEYINDPPITYSVNGKQYVAIYVKGNLPSSPTGTGHRDLLTVFSLPST